MVHYKSYRTLLKIKGVASRKTIWHFVDDIYWDSFRTKDLTHYSFLFLKWSLSLENLRFIQVSDTTVDLEKSFYSTKYFYKSIYFLCMVGFYVGIFHHCLVGCLEQS
jgi:hypothetical protein